MLLLFASLAIMLIAGVPIAACLVLSSLLYLSFYDLAPHIQVLYRMVNGIDSFPLLAVPFFILAGSLMNEGGITTRIFDFAKACVGWMRGGLGHVNIIASMIFAGMSGAAVADAGGLGNIEIKAMRDAGYEEGFSIGVTAASSTIGPIIPPSLAMVIYGVMASCSIGKLFVAGLLPGVLTACALSFMVIYISRKRNYSRDASFSAGNLWFTFRRAFLSLLAPVLVVGGMVTGIYTPTEAAVAVCAYAMFLGVVVYRTLTWKRFVQVSLETAETTAIILFIVAGASIFSWILTANNVATNFAEYLLDLTQNKIIILILINLILLVVGCFIDTLAAITIMTPILLPIVTKLGISPIHFGVLMVLNLNIGLLTPPVGVVLYVLGRVAKVPFETVMRGVLPFLVPLVIVLILLTFIPQFSMWLPDLVYGR